MVRVAAFYNAHKSAPKQWAFCGIDSVLVGLSTFPAVPTRGKSLQTRLLQMAWSSTSATQLGSLLAFSCKVTVPMAPVTQVHARQLPHRVSTPADINVSL